MSEQSHEKTCPFCANPNRCGVGGLEPCWCIAAVIPRELTGLLSAESKGCICQNCVNAFQRNPALDEHGLRSSGSVL